MRTHLLFKENALHAISWFQHRQIHIVSKISSHTLSRLVNSANTEIRPLYHGGWLKPMETATIVVIKSGHVHLQEVVAFTRGSN